MLIQYEETDGWSMIPGPSSYSDPLHSTDMQDLAEINASKFASALASLPGVVVEAKPEPDLWHLVCVSRAGDEFIRLTFTLMGEHEVLWGGSQLTCSCSIENLLAFWRRLKGVHPDIYVHDRECRVYDERSFIRAQARS